MRILNSLKEISEHFVNVNECKWDSKGKVKWIFVINKVKSVRYQIFLWVLSDFMDILI